MPVAKINATTLFFDQIGKGRDCLVLHGGLGLDHQLYKATLHPLSHRLRLTFVDQRCNGRSGRPPIESLTMEQLAADAAGLISELALDDPIVFGHSYGGFVAQELALSHPTCVGALILADTSPGNLGELEDPEGEQGAAAPAEVVAVLSGAQTDQPGTDEAFGLLMADWMSRFYLHKPIPGDVAAAFDETIFNLEAMRRSMQVLGTWSSVDRLRELEMAALVLVGRHDVFTSPPQSMRIASRLGNSQYVEFDESGHFPWIDEADPFFHVVGEWLDLIGC